MLKKIEGIITRTVKYGESSVILDLLTSEDSIQSFIIGGVRSKGKKNKAALVRVLNIVNVEAYHKDDDRLSRIKEISYAHIYKSIPFDVVKGSMATFLIEICRKAVKESDNSTGIYNHIIKGLIHIDNASRDLAHFHILFLIKLARHLGFAINSNYTSELLYFNIKDGTFHSMREDHRMSLDEHHSLILNYYLKEKDYQIATRPDRRALTKTLVDYYRYHIDDFGELKSLDILMSLYD